ncbi:MAG: PadR family transcriptional regulator [Actinomycetota bacterium]
MGIREGMLALLARGDAHGYQLKVDLEAATGEMWSINVGQVYTTLSRLERDRLVTSSGSDAQGRIVYRITDAGREAVAAWMAGPVELAAAGRDEISLKLMVALASGLDARRVVEVQRSATMGLLQDYTALKAAADDRDLAWQLQLDRLILSAEAELRWLERVEDRLDPAPASEPVPGSEEVRT